MLRVAAGNRFVVSPVEPAGRWVFILVRHPDTA
jgi:hypothetical protein